ncbi:MAG: hypothetical protein ACN4GF_11635 [Lentimonas sp.]
MLLKSSHAATQSWQMPQQADEIHLSWVAGPPQFQVFRSIDLHLEGFREKAADLAFRSEKWGMVFDPRRMTIEKMTLGTAKDAVVDTLNFSTLSERWSASELDLQAKINGKVYRPVGGSLARLAKDYNYSPIHIVESGPWFQHVAIYDLDLVDGAGQKFAAKSWLEIRAWGDRCTFEWFVEPASEEELLLSIGLKAEALKVNQNTSANAKRVQLSVSFSGGSAQPISKKDAVSIQAVAKNDYTLSAPTVAYSTITDAWEVTIPKQNWEAASKAAFNEAYLDRISRFDLKLENTSSESRDLSLRFIHDYHSISGFVPMLLDQEGAQTGIPIQNSKNWHTIPNEPYPYEGTWINQTTRLTLAPNSVVELQYVVVHALWQGVPASSAAQLSLVGWGYNGFWTQMALGSWGETLCLQPGRTMRRAFVTDVRPLEMLSEQGLKYDWTTNVGGADVAKVVDANGKYIQWEGAVREFEMIGPNLSHVRVMERSTDERMRLQIDTYLPRSNSINRSYFKVQLDVLENVALSELALFQLGSDYYNEMESRKIAWGNTAGLTEAASPKAAEWGRVMDAIPLLGEQPWVSLYDNQPDTARRGRGVRGMVVRDFKATLSGKVDTQPWLLCERTMTFLNAELTLDPKVKQLKAGDRIEFTLELDIFPLSAESYYGANTALEQRLSKSPDSWELTAFESRNQQLTLNGEAQVFPATYVIETKSKTQQFTVESRSSMDAVRITGLSKPGSWQLTEQLDGESLELGARFPVEKSPQVVYDTATQTWTVVLSLVFPEGATKRTFSVKQL